MKTNNQVYYQQGGGDEQYTPILIPSRRMRFFNKRTGETGNQPTFKASYFGVNIFKRQIILQDMEIAKKNE